MKHIKAVAVGAAAAALLWGTAGLADDVTQSTTRSQKTIQMKQENPSGVQTPPTQDWSRGVPGQDSDIHGTSGSAIMDDSQGVGGSGLSRDNDVNGMGGSGLIQDNSMQQKDMGLGRVGSGGTGDLDHNQQGDLRTGSDTHLGIGGSGDMTKTTTEKTTTTKTKAKKGTKDKTNTGNAMGKPENATGSSTNATGGNEGVDKNPTQPNPNRTETKPAPTPAPAPTP